MHCQGRANPPAWIIAKHRIQSTLRPPRISLLLKDFLPVKTLLSQTGTSLESYLLSAAISNYPLMERWLTFSVLPRSEKWVGGCRSHTCVWAMTLPTVPAKLLLRHESQAHASSAAMLTLEEDERERGTWLGCLWNVGGLPWAVTKCSYNPLISSLMENHNNSCMAALMHQVLLASSARLLWHVFVLKCIWHDQKTVFSAAVTYKLLYVMALVSLSFKAVWYFSHPLTSFT